MKNKRSTKHRGEVLQAVVEATGLSITMLSKRVGYSRSSYYNHIMDAELSFDILAHYGKGLKYDFSADFPEMMKQLFEEDPEDYAPVTLDQAIRQRDQWKDKYYSLLEKHQQLLEDRLKK